MERRAQDSFRGREGCTLLAPQFFQRLLWHHHKGRPRPHVRTALAALTAPPVNAGVVAPGSASRPVMTSQVCPLGFRSRSGSGLSYAAVNELSNSTRASEKKLPLIFPTKTCLLHSFPGPPPRLLGQLPQSHSVTDTLCVK